MVRSAACATAALLQCARAPRLQDYIVPGACTDTEFRKMWADFEWENKVGVNTTITDMREYLEHVARATNMKLLTSGVALGE